MSTAPKSIQAMGGADQDRRQIIQEFLNKYKPLPDDFLRVSASYYQIQQQQLHQHQHQHHMDTLTRGVGLPSMAGQTSPMIDMIEISVVEAQLVKNYGLLRMDLYCKIRVGHMVCETNTSQNCAKNPKFDGVYQFALKPGIDSFHLEIYDEKQFSLDEKIAWLHEPIPSEIFQGITVERWYPLSGRLGKDKEGSVLLVISHKTKLLGRHMLTDQEIYLPPPPAPLTAGSRSVPGTILPVDPNIHIPTYIQPPTTPAMNTTTINPSHATESSQQLAPGQGQQESVRAASEEDINQMAEMFPSIDRNIIKTILENNNHDKDSTISTLLAMG